MTKHEIMIEYVKEKVDELTNAILTFNYAGDVPFFHIIFNKLLGKGFEEIFKGGRQRIWLCYIDHLAILHGIRQLEHTGNEFCTGIHGLD